MKFELNEYHFNVPDQDLISDLKKVAQKLHKKTISRNEYDKNGKYSEGTLRKRFGGWLNALEMAGLKKTRHYLKDDEILDELKRIAKFLGKNSLTKEDLRKYSAITNGTVVERHFGSWNKAVKKASLSISPTGRRYSIDDYFENLLNVWTYLGRQPLSREMNTEPSQITSRAYEHRFGGWRKALEAFVTRMNQDESAQGPGQGIQKEKSVNQKEMITKEIEVQNKECRIEAKRDIGLSLRYKVLSRDKFKCVKCGISPATDHFCRLHVDHKLPFSQGGKTILENLQTLCENCNLGKGNRYLD